MRYKKKRKGKRGNRTRYRPRRKFLKRLNVKGIARPEEIKDFRTRDMVLMSLQRYRRIGLVDEVTRHYFKISGAHLEFYNQDSFLKSILRAPDEFIALLKEYDTIRLDDNTIVDFTAARSYLEELAFYLPKDWIRLFLQDKEKVIQRLKFVK